MAVTAERVVVDLEARFADFQRQSAATADRFERQLNSMQATARRTESSINKSFSSIGNAARLLGTYLSAQKVIAWSDAYTRATNSLKVAGLEGQRLSETFNKLFGIAQRNGVAVEDLAKLFGRVTMSQKQLGITTEQVGGLTETVAAALKASGTTAASAAGSILGLNQALSQGRVQGDEFNQVLDGMPLIAQAAANGFIEAGGSIGKLKQLMEDGKISSKGLFYAIMAGSADIKDKAAKAVETYAQMWVRVENAFVNAIGKSNEMLNVSGDLSRGVDGLVQEIDKLPEALRDAADAYGQILGIIKMVAEWLPKISFRQSIAEMQALAHNAAEISRWFNETNTRDFFAGRSTGPNLRTPGDFSGGPPMGPPVPKGFVSPDAAPPGWNDPDMFPAARGTPANVPLPPARPTRTYSPISVNQYKPDGSGTDSAANKKAKATESQRYVESLKEEQAAIEAEAAALGKSNLEKQIAINLAEAGSKATDAEREQIIARTTAIEEAKNKIKEYAEAQRALETEVSFFGDSLATAFKSAILQGEKLSDVMRNLLNSLASRSIDKLFDLFFGAPGGGGGSSLVGSFVSSLLPQKAGGGTLASGQIAMVGEMGPEIIKMPRNGAVIPNHELGRMGNGGGGFTVAPVFSIDARFAQPGMEMKLQKMMISLISEFKRDLPQHFSEAQKRGGW